LKVFLSTLKDFWASLFGRKKIQKEPTQPNHPTVEDVARQFYSDLLDADSKRKK